MADKARKNGLTFKPHMKTHQSAEIGKWFKDLDVTAITVSSVKMARYFADHSWDDITIAFPCNIRQIDEINNLASDVSLTLILSNIQTAEFLREQLSARTKIYIELDAGSSRTGLQVSDLTKIKKLISTLVDSSNLHWIGFYSHPGHSYSARSKKEIREVHKSVTEQIHQLRVNLEPEFGSFEVCIGDTPCCSVADDFDSIDAISPGNFVFYDLMQVQIGSCEVQDIATALACPIVDIYPSRNEIAIYGGAIHFSKESLQTNNFTHFGQPAATNKKGWEIYDSETYLKSLSQEHGIIKCSDKIINDFSVGDTIDIIPVHSCLTAHLIGEYLFSGGQVVQQLT